MRSMTDDAARNVELSIPVRSDAELDALEQALLRARASELAEVRRRQVRLSAGYGDTATRASMDDESARAELRHAMLDRLVQVLRMSR